MIHSIYYRRFTLDRVIDGDTVVGTVDNGFYTTIKQSFRLFGINTPELNSPDPAVRAAAFAATTELRSQFGTHHWLVRTYKNPADKYGRFLGEFIRVLADDGKGMITVDGETLNAAMVRLGHAVEYMV